MNLAFVAAAAFAAAQAAVADIRVADDRGREIVLARPAARIVTLAPHLTEIAFAAGAGAKVVGVSAYSDFPAEAARLPIVSDHGKVNFEEIATLKPDLALMWASGNRAPDFDRLESRGVQVFATEARRPEDIARILRLVGRLAGTETVADAAARDLEARFAALRERYRGRPNGPGVLRDLARAADDGQRQSPDLVSRRTCAAGRTYSRTPRRSHRRSRASRCSPPTRTRSWWRRRRRAPRIGSRSGARSGCVPDARGASTRSIPLRRTA